MMAVTPDGRPHTPRRVLCAIALACAAVAMVGCANEPYTVRGRVLHGDSSYISIVGRNDGRLEGVPISGASVQLVLDPGRLKSETVGKTVTDAEGRFAIPVEKFGASWLEYQAGLFVRKEGYTPAELPFELPSQKKRALVILSPGEDRPFQETHPDPYEEFQKYSEEW